MAFVIMEMLALQKAIASWASKKFPDRDIMGAVNKLVLEEIPELVKELPSPEGDRKEAALAGELGDCFILLLDIADMLGIDAAEATFEKLDELRARSWKRNPLTGFYNHSKE